MTVATPEAPAKKAAKPAATPPTEKPEKPEEEVDWTSVHEIPLTAIEHGRNPRTVIELPRQKELNESVKQHGVLMPIRVRPIGDGKKFQIVAGHRRFEAAKSAKLAAIPAVVAMPDDNAAFVQSIVENLQREDLDPIDEANALKALLKETKWSQEVLGKQIGRSQPYIANRLALLGLEPEVMNAIAEGKLTASHGKAMVGLAPERQKVIANTVIKEKIPSRQVEVIVAEEKSRQKEQEVAEAARKEAVRVAIEKMAAYVAEKKVQPADLIVYATQGYLSEAFAAAGYAQRPPDWKEITSEPDWKCDCQAKAVEYDGWRGIRPICFVSQHHKDYVKARDAERRKAAEKATKATTAARSAIASSLGSVAAMTDDGLRAALYLIVTSSRGSYGSRGVDQRAFVTRYGGAPRSEYSSDYGDVWDVIEGMTMKDVVSEMSKFIAQIVQPNVWTSASSGVEHDWKLREYLAEKKVVAKAAVYGDGGVPERIRESDAKRQPKVEAKPAAAKTAAKTTATKAAKVDLTKRAD